jgi:hypothetical protein
MTATVAATAAQVNIMHGTNGPGFTWLTWGPITSNTLVALPLNAQNVFIGSTNFTGFATNAGKVNFLVRSNTVGWVSAYGRADGVWLWSTQPQMFP